MSSIVEVWTVAEKKLELREWRERRKEEKRLKAERTGPSPERQAEKRVSANDKEVDKMIDNLGPLSG